MLDATIDGIKLQVPEGSTILDAANVTGVNIPTLCYMKDMIPDGSCRICLVSVEGAPALVPACVFPVVLSMVLIAGSELYTGNNLIIVSVLEKETKLSQMLINWVLVYLGNIIGGMVLVGMMYWFIYLRKSKKEKLADK